MRYLLLFLLFPFCLQAQYFTLNDSVFKVGQVMICRQIFFDFDKATLRPQSKLFLDSVVVFLDKFDSLHLEIGNHTDFRGNDQYNHSLTKARARAVMNYLVSKGIEESRLKSVGYGETRPIIPESVIRKMKTKEEQEAAHQTNRRTELKILKL